MTTTMDSEKSSAGDVIFMVMGPSGSGKSTFINHATRAQGHHRAPISHGYDPCTKEIRGYTVPTSHPFYKQASSLPVGRKVTLVDTPGFDGTIDAVETIKNIGDYLKATASVKSTIGGMIYVFPSYPDRFAASKTIDLDTFRDICGIPFFPKIVFGLTRQGLCPTKAILEGREAELRDNYWQPFLSNGAHMKYLDDSQESADAILSLLVDRALDDTRPKMLEELLDSDRVEETTAEQGYRRWTARRFAEKLLSIIRQIFSWI